MPEIIDEAYVKANRGNSFIRLIEKIAEELNTDELCEFNDCLKRGFQRSEYVKYHWFYKIKDLFDPSHNESALPGVKERIQTLTTDRLWQMQEEQ